MIDKKSTINVDVDKQIKKEAEVILKDLELNMNTFINMLLIQLVKRNEIPFEIDSSKASDDLSETLEKMINNPEKYPRYSNWEELKESLLSDD